MTPQELIRRCRDLADVGDDSPADADSLIGFFQLFRPDGARIQGLFDGLDQGPALEERLARLYQAAGSDRRPGGGRDAYFIVRQPEPLEPDRARSLAEAWIVGVRAIAIAVGDDEISEMLAPLPDIRVLEGIPPKHPKQASERSHLLRTVQHKTPAMIEGIAAGPIAELLRPAYYFTACDAMLRDHLMWPFFAPSTGLQDPLAAYYDLWSHGVKYRIFGESRIDLYLPRH